MRKMALSLITHRPGLVLATVTGACAMLTLSTSGFAQNPPPAADCAPTETQAECHDRLKCLADEELDDCKKRLRGEGETEDGDDQGDDDQGDDARDRQDRGGDAVDRREREDDRRDRQDRDDDDDDDYDDDDRGGGRGGRGGRGVLRPGTRPGFFSGGVGPSFVVCYGSDCDLRGDIAQFYGTLDFGWHLMGKGFEGPAIGANIHGGFGRVANFDTGRFGAGFKFWWDIQLKDDLGLYLTPFAQVGPTSFFYESDRYCYYDPSLGRRVCPNASNDEHFFNAQFGMMARLILGDRGLVYFQPVTFDTVFNGDGAGLLYHLELGGGVIFGG